MSQHAQVGMIVEPQDRVLSSDTGTTYLNNTLSNIVLVGATDANLERSGLVAESSLDRDEGEKGQGGYEYSAGFADRTTGASGVSSIGSNVSYPQSLVDTQTWMRFGVDATPSYLFWPGAMRRIAAYDPQMRVILSRSRLSPAANRFCRWRMWCFRTMTSHWCVRR